MRSRSYAEARTESGGSASELAGPRPDRADRAESSADLGCRGVSDVFRHQVRVRYGECDLQGVVFNANWLAYFDVVITELWRARVCDYMDMVNGGVDMVVAEAGVRFHASARFDDVVEFELRIKRLGETSFSSAIHATVDGRAAVEGSMRHVFVDAGTSSKCAIPDFVREGLAPLVVDKDAAPQEAARTAQPSAS